MEEPKEVITRLYVLKIRALSEISQIEKDKYHRISLLCRIKQNKNKLTDTQNRLVVTRGLGAGGG